MKKKITGRTLVTAAILIGLVILLFNPGILPFLSKETQDAISLAMKAAFGTTGDVKLLSIPTLLTIAAVVAFVMAINRILRFAFSKVALNSGRSRTVMGLLLSVLNYATAIFGGVWVLSLLGVNVTGIFASLGILSLVVGFGAQSLIEDIITGVFIIFEGQYNIGDIIILDNFRGTVRKIGVRTTTLEDAGGNLKIINNSDVRNLQNRSQNLSVALCDVNISYKAPLLEVENLLRSELPVITAQANGMFLQEIEYLGVQELASSAVVLRFAGTVHEADLFIAQRYLNRAFKLLFDAHGIEIPFNQLVVHTESTQKGSV